MRFDSEGGGHANACGCRIKIIDENESNERKIRSDDIEQNLEEWVRMWSKNILNYL
jgi:nanoRNase/pAp phosphatase (c-di-AMP/oligoRNAs hydrolase)